MIKDQIFVIPVTDGKLTLGIEKDKLAITIFEKEVIDLKVLIDAGVAKGMVKWLQEWLNERAAKLT